MTSLFNPSFPIGCNANGVHPDGSYGQYQYPAEGHIVACNNKKSYVLNDTTAQIACNFEGIELPQGVVGPDGWYELEVLWGANNSANVKTLNVAVHASNLTATDTLTTGQSSRFKIQIFNRGATNSQVVPANNPLSGVGSSANAVQTLTRDLSAYGEGINITGTLTAASNGDSMWIESWVLKAYNPPVYSKPRLNYGKVQFYGCNGHYDDTQSIAQHISDMKVLGMKTLRITYEGPGSLASLINYAQAIKTDNTGIQICCCIDYPSANTYANELAAYTDAFNTAVTVVNALSPLGVMIYEGGNELDTKGGMNVNGGQGGFPSDFSNTLVPMHRGTQRGHVDGVHAANANCLAASNAYTVCSLALALMMWNGTQPDGTTNHPVVRWDITNWHNYEDYGSLMSITLDFQKAQINLLASLNRYFGVPIIITEFNGKASDTDPQRAAWISRCLYEYYTNRYKYNIAFVCVYELYGSPWQLMASAGTPVSTFGTTVQAFIAANPDTGL